MAENEDRKRVQFALPRVSCRIFVGVKIPGRSTLTCLHATGALKYLTVVLGYSETNQC